MDQSEAINKVREYSQLLKRHLAFEKIYLYGSFAKNTYSEDSDIDVAIIVNHIEDDFFAINPLLWKIRREIDHRIEPILIEKSNDKSGFLTEIQKNGIEII